MITIVLMIIPDDIANLLQYLAPIVFGITSEKINIRRVRMADTIPKYISLKILVAWAPTPAAPMV